MTIIDTEFAFYIIKEFIIRYLEFAVPFGIVYSLILGFRRITKM